MNSEDYEIFVKEVFEELLEDKSVKVYHLKEYTGKVSKRIIKIDISFETQVLGTQILFLVECKHYKNRIDVGEVEEFYSKLNDIGAHKGIMVTTIGYQEGAIKTAKGRGIALVTLSVEASETGLIYSTKSYNIEKNEKQSKLFVGNVIFNNDFSDSKDNRIFSFKSVNKFIDILRVSIFNDPYIIQHTQNLW